MMKDKVVLIRGEGMGQGTTSWACCSWRIS